MRAQVCVFVCTSLICSSVQMCVHVCGLLCMCLCARVHACVGVRACGPEPQSKLAPRPGFYKFCPCTCTDISPPDQEVTGECLASGVWCWVPGVRLWRVCSVGFLVSDNHSIAAFKSDERQCDAIVKIEHPDRRLRIPLHRPYVVARKVTLALAHLVYFFACVRHECVTLNHIATCGFNLPRGRYQGVLGLRSAWPLLQF